jgi:hypothetical protein
MIKVSKDFGKTCVVEIFQLKILSSIQKFEIVS